MKKIIAIALTLAISLSMAGCSSTKTSTFRLGGQTLKVQLDTTDNYDMVSGKYLEISQNGEPLTQCAFMEMAYEDYLTLISRSAEDWQVLETGERDGNSYTLFQVTEDETPTYGCAVQVADAGFTVILSSKISQQSARDCFDRLTFTLK